MDCRALVADAIPDASHPAAFDLDARRRWAMRRGNPAWLWPEVTIADWRTALRAIEPVVRAVLVGDATPPMLDGDPPAVELACYTSGTGPLLGWWQDRGMLGAAPGIVPILSRHLRHNRIRAARMTAAAGAVVDRLAAHDIPVAILKGAHSAEDYFPAPGTRPASDVDLLVPARHAWTAELVIGGAGFGLIGRGPRESTWRPAGGRTEPRSLTMVHADDPWSIDLHDSLDLLVAAGAPVAALDTLRPLDGARRWTPNPWATVLDQPALLLHLAVHAGAGLHNLTLLRLIELHLVITRDRAAGRLDWQAVLAAGEAAGLLGYAWPALDLCEKLAPGTVPSFVRDRCAGAAPAAVRRIVAGLTPASAQRIGETSLAEHFMWSRGWIGLARQVAHDISLPRVSWRASRTIYERRAWQLLRAVRR